MAWSEDPFFQQFHNRNRLGLAAAVQFPDPRLADDHGLLAVGGSYHPQVLIKAYASGIFPWPSEELPYAWFSPNPRLLLYPPELHVSRSLRKCLRQAVFRMTFDTVFEQVIRHCSTAPRPGQRGTWINEELIQGFLGLHQLGFAHSVETWMDDQLVGGLYGLSLGGMFCGESMFALKPNASKVAFVHLVEQLQQWDFHLVDCQVRTDHLVRFGARERPRERFLQELKLALETPTRRGPWTQLSAE